MVQFNKMFVMVPVMLAARKLNSEDPLTVQYLRIAYSVMQVVCVAIALYVYRVASTVSYTTTTIYVPPTPQVCCVCVIVAAFVV
jgi:Phosphate transport (Pho88)